MGLDLTVYIDTHNLGWDTILGHTRLDFTRHRALFDVIDTFEPSPLGNTLQLYADEGLTTTATDAYGTALTTLAVAQWGAILHTHVSQDGHWNGTYPLSKRNHATLTYLSMLEPDTIIILYWH